MSDGLIIEKKYPEDAAELTISGFNTETAGTRTLVVSYQGQSFNIVYTVIEETEELYAGGTGTENDPYQIVTAQHLNNVRVNLDSHYVLMNDIDLSGVQWTPIGDRHDAAFSGSFDGDGHTLKLAFAGEYRGPNTAISSSNTKGDGFGLFGWTTGNFTTIDLTLDVNFDLTTVSTTYASYLAGLAGIY